MLKCPICGMIINENNYNFNEDAFLMKNSKDNIIYCPFCGIDITYMSNEPDFLKNEQEISDEKTLLILDHAMKLEVYNGDFYKIVSEKACDKETKDLFKALSNIELTHAVIHKNLGKFTKLPTLINIDYSNIKGNSALIQAANQREVHAVDYYNKYYSSIKDAKIKYVFEALASVEKGHISLLKNAIK